MLIGPGEGWAWWDRVIQFFEYDFYFLKSFPLDPVGVQHGTECVWWACIFGIPKIPYQDMHSYSVTLVSACLTRFMFKSCLCMFVSMQKPGICTGGGCGGST